MIDSTLLTNIADAVRSVDGSTNTLTPEQMATRLAAVKSSIDAALSALTSKEIEVPSGSNVHRLAELIASIQTGGGLPDGIAAITTGTYTPANSEPRCTIEHGLLQMPDFLIIRSAAGKPLYSNIYAITMAVVSYDRVQDRHDIFLYATKGTLGGGGTTFGANKLSRVNSLEITLNGEVYPFNKNLSAGITTNFYAGQKYTWYAGVFA